ncbi:hypothetical protein B484DRAFT_286294 [Ochromonadaceae sp. CCMP2298]|nr:hypothetical protein B484DRAFT_286294 [Ochromonadaceae sp. CCMP2298]
MQYLQWAATYAFAVACIRTTTPHTPKSTVSPSPKYQVPSTKSQVPSRAFADCEHTNSEQRLTSRAPHTSTPTAKKSVRWSGVIYFTTPSPRYTSADQTVTNTTIRVKGLSVCSVCSPWRAGPGRRESRERKEGRGERMEERGERRENREERE